MTSSSASADGLAAEHRRHAVEANNATWEFLDGRELSGDERAEVLARAHAAAFHWARASGRAPANAARADWLVSRVYAVLGWGAPALEFADRCAATVAEHGLDDFDLAYAHEARARALACLGRLDEADTERSAAAAVSIAGDEDRSIFETDLGAGPWFGLEA